MFQLKIAKSKCEKRIHSMGGPDYKYYECDDAQSTPSIPGQKVSEKWCVKVVRRITVKYGVFPVVCWVACLCFFHSLKTLSYIVFFLIFK